MRLIVKDNKGNYTVLENGVVVIRTSNKAIADYYLMNTGRTLNGSSSVESSK